jgi:dynein intermediate chain 2
MTDIYTYQKKRREFGRHCNFQDTKTTMHIGFLPDHESDKSRGFESKEVHIKRDPNFIELTNIPEMSENTVNTERVSVVDRKMYHYEGGWPAGIDITDPGDKAKYIKKKLEKTSDNLDKFTPAVKRITENVHEIIDKNNQIDMFEEYFLGEEPEHNIEKLSIKTLMLFKDQNDGIKRSVSKLCWHPDGPYSIAASYSISRFQQQPAGMKFDAYTWDLNSPNVPKDSLVPPSPLTTLAYNHKNVDQIAFGCYNGLVGVWDVRTNVKAERMLVSQVENSHHEPVIDLIWLSSKGGNEFVTCSTDGRVNWWDCKALEKGPTDTVVVTENVPERDDQNRPIYDQVIGCTTMEYVPDFGPKYLMGTERGSIMLGTKKPKKNCEINYNTSYGLEMGRHLGPVYSLMRNPMYPRYFMSVGDWSVNIWEEEEKTPIIKTRYHPSYLTDGCWAPNRPGLFFVTRRDGWLDIWDYFYRQNEVALSHKVADASLTCLKLNTVTGSSQIGVHHPNVGKYCAIGDSDGTITLLELCPSLYESQPKEKDVIDEIFKREKQKESALKRQRVAAELKRAAQAKDSEKQKASQVKDLDSSKRETMVKEADDAFHSCIDKTRELMKEVLVDEAEGGEQPEPKSEGSRQNVEAPQNLEQSQEVEPKADEGKFLISKTFIGSEQEEPVGIPQEGNQDGGEAEEEPEAKPEEEPEAKPEEEPEAKPEEEPEAKPEEEPEAKPEEEPEAKPEEPKAEE